MKAFDGLQAPLQGTSLVEASAGTGKTYAISTLFVRLVLEADLTVDQILVVTFTEAATAELRDRIRKRLNEAATVCVAMTRGAPTDGFDPTLVELVARQTVVGLAHKRITQALYRFDNAAIFTIHGFCQRVLRENAFATQVAFDTELLQDTRPLVQEISTDFWLSRLSRAPLFLVQGFANTFAPGKRDLESFTNTTAQAPHLELLPRDPLPPGTLDDSEYEAAFRAAKQLYDKAALETLLVPVYANAGHRASREKKLTDYFDAAFGTCALPDVIKFFTTAKLTEECRKSARNPKPVPSHPFFEAADRLMAAEAAFAQALERHKVQLKRDLVTYLQHEMAARKVKRRQLSFDDLLTQLAAALSGPLGHRLVDALRLRYRAALIDEFQDTDPVQYSIFSRLFVRKETYGADVTLFLIGDPKQAIYSFRGADVFAYLDAAEQVDEARRFTMLTNYRSDEALVAAVNALFLRHQRPFLYEQLSYPDVGAKQQGPSSLLPAPGMPAPKPFEFRFVQSASDKAYSNVALARHLPARVANHVVSLLTSGSTLDGQPLAPRSIAILTRTNREAFECQRALALRGVPSVVQGDRSVFEQPDAQELKFVLAAIVEPKSATRLRAALATDLLGLSAIDIDALTSNELAWDGWVERFQLYNAIWHKEGFIQMFRQLLLECGVTHRLLASLNGERRITNVLHLAELLHTQSQLEHLGPSGLLQYLAEQCERQEPPGDSEQVRLESDEDAVVLTTIHKSKGLEYPIVLCPFMAGAASWFQSKQWVMFHAEETRAQTVDLGTSDFEAHAKLKQQEDLSEALRLVYVAFTRAKHRCIVYWGAFGNEFHKSGLAELLYGPENNGDLSSLKKAGDAQLLAPLQALARENVGFGVELEKPFDPTEDEPVLMWEKPSRDTTVTLEAKHVTRRINHWLRTASFTELTRDLPHAAIQPASDHDELAPLLTLASPDVNLQQRTLLADFPGGANVGNFFHSILETMDFREPASPERVTDALRAHGLKPELLELALEGLKNTTQTEFAPGLSLSRLAPERRLNELEFMLPVAQGAQALTGERLAQAFALYPSHVVPPSYAQQVAALPFIALSGYLKGFVDLIFEFENKWYLVDYKTNTLGARWEHYALDPLIECMCSSHYILQYHLYTLALHRYLERRVRGYDYETHFGGVYYLFLRGMHPEHGAQSGVFYDKPPLARLRLLSLALSGETLPQVRIAETGPAGVTA